MWSISYCMGRRPIDLSTIKKNIESGSTRSTTEFHRDLTLMFLNSIIYNPIEHEVHRLAKEMLAECNTIVQVGKLHHEKKLK